MAKQLNYTHPNGTNYPESYWRITRLFVDVPSRYAKFDFTGYKNAQARLGNLEPIGYRYLEITGTDFDFGFGEVTMKVKNPQEVAYDYCILYKDLIRRTVVNEGQEDEHEEEEKYSFFENAQDV